MSIKLQLPKIIELKPRITVVGVGGAGGNAVNNMIASGLSGVEFVVANTDAQALAVSSSENRIQLGINLTEGLGAGSKPEIGQAAAEEALDDIRAQIEGSHMVFIAAGMGGGTGTGAAAVIARTAKELGILVVAIVTKPFQFEGTRRLRMADAGIAELRKYVDTMIVIPNQNLFRIANERTTFAEAFVLADQVLYSGIACIVDLIVKEGLINLDFADVRTVLSGMGSAMMGTGEASGERRAIRAAEEAIANPLLDDVSLRGAKGLLLSIIGGRNLTLYEVDEAASRVRQEVDVDANIIVGATFDDSLEDRVRVSIVASGMADDVAQTTAANANGPRVTPPPTPVALDRPAPSASGPAEVRAVAPASRYAEPKTRPLPGEPTAMEAEELARALAATYDQRPAMPAPVSSAPGRAEMAKPPQPKDHASVASRPIWESADGVQIRDGIDLSSSSQQPPPLPQSRPDAVRYSTAPPIFTPQQPTEVKRPSRRMPELDDFPEIGQRDFTSKQPAAAGRAPASVQPRIFSTDSEGPKRKPGLFERLTGRPWREAENDSFSGSGYPQVTHNSPDRPAQRHDAAVQQRQNTSLKQGGSPDPQDAELPVFFDKKRR